MRPIIRYSLKQIVFMNLVFVVLIVAGVMSLVSMPVENLPPIAMGEVFINTFYPGASAEDVENLVTSKIEDAVDGLENVEFVLSRSYRNLSSVKVKFNDDTDYEELYDDLRFRVLNAEELPPEAEVPTFFYIDTQIWMPVVIVNIAGELPNRTLTLLAEELKSNILGVEGVKSVGLRGEYTQEFHVSLDPDKLRRNGISFEVVARAIEAANVKIPTGRLRSGDASYMLDAGRRLASQSEVLDVVVRRDGDGTFIHVRDLVVNARLWHRDPMIISSVDGMDAVSLIITKESTANSVEITKEIKSMSKAYAAAHEGDGIMVKITNDSTIEIDDSVNTLKWNLIIGMFLVTCVLWMTLGFRNAMLAAIGIPFSFLCTILFLDISGRSINTISLFSFVLVSGIIVDDAIVILENTFRHMQMGKGRVQAIVDGAGEVALPVISSALTTILAFLPLLIMTGSIGEFFSVIPVTVSFALFASLIEALFILPVHIYDWGPRREDVSDEVDEAGKEELSRHLSEGMFAPVWQVYFKLLNVLLAHKYKAMGVLGSAFVAASLIFGLSMSGAVPLMKVEFFPGSYFRYHVVVKFPPGTSIEKTDSAIRDLTKFVSSFGPGEALTVRGDAGLFEAQNYVWHRAEFNGQLVITLPPQKDRRFPDNPDNDPYIYLDQVRKRLKDYVAQKYSGDAVMPELEVFAENTGPPTGEPVNIRVTGDSRQMVSHAAESIVDYLKSDEQFGGLTDLVVNRAKRQRVVRYVPDFESAYERGLSPAVVTSLVAGALNGMRAGKFKTGDEDVDLLVRIARVDDEGNLSGAGISRPSDVLDVPMVEHSAAPVYLRELVNMKYVTEPSVRTRYNGKPALTITSGIARDSSLTSSRVSMLVRKYAQGMSERFPGVTVAFGGEFDTTSRAYASLFTALIIAALCIYMVLASQFKDYLHPLIIISAIVFAFIGVVFGVFLTRSIFTIGSAMAVVGLAGVAVNDSLILIDFINVRRREGMAVRDAIIRAASTRMRPVLITTFTTMFGLLPMAIGIPHKSIAWAPMATAFVTGLCTATTLALLMIPVEYELAEDLRKFTKRNSKKLSQRFGPAITRRFDAVEAAGQRVLLGAARGIHGSIKKIIERFYKK